MNKQELDAHLIWHPFTPLEGSDPNLLIAKAEGAVLYTDTGAPIIDAIASWWVNLHGHGHPQIAQAIFEQAQTLEHVMFAGFTHIPAIKLAANLLSILPDNQKKIFFSDNGSTAVEVALKMAMQYWHHQGGKKRSVVALDGGYHGDTFGGMSVGERGPFTTPFWPYLFEVDFIPFPVQGQEERTVNTFRSLLSKNQVGVFIFEPLIQGASGMRMYTAKLLDELIRLAKEHRVICIADEVMTGFGRTGTLFASDQLACKPDIFCLSKGLTGGAMALGATSCTEEIQTAFRHKDLMKTFFHGHSFTANPLACAAANASYELLISPQCRMDIQRISDHHSKFKAHVENLPKVRSIRHMGVILALELETSEQTSYVNEARHKLYPYFISQGVLIRPLGNVIYILPPYVITDDQLEKSYATIEELLLTN